MPWRHGSRQAAQPDSRSVYTDVSRVRRPDGAFQGDDSMAKKPFKGMIKLDVRDSVPDWEPYLPTKAPAGRAERPVRAVRRHRPGRLVAVRRQHQHADAAEAGRQRPDVLAVAHDGAVLADPLHVPDRPQPSPQRHAPASRKAPTDSPARTAAFPTSAPRSGRSCRTTAGARSGWARTTTSPSRTSPRARAASEWPLQKGFDRFYGFLGGETNQLVSRPGRGQPLHRPAVQPGGGLSPLQGPRRPGDRG